MVGNHRLTMGGRDIDYIARRYHMDLALAWALRLEGKTDQEKFKGLGWGLRTCVRTSRFLSIAWVNYYEDHFMSAS
ncbi:MAG: hypothetical protein KAV83_11630 [Desulfobacterales bacterium]|nr:hypothetical protein [Desulfobacterales bacterium]